MKHDAVPATNKNKRKSKAAIALSHMGDTSRKNVASYFQGPNPLFKTVKPKPDLRYAAAQKKFPEVVTRPAVVW